MNDAEFDDPPLSAADLRRELTELRLAARSAEQSLEWIKNLLGPMALLNVVLLAIILWRLP